MRRWRAVRVMRRMALLLPGILVVQQLGCLPEGAFSEVLVENIVFTSAVAIQSVTSLVFNTLFSFFNFNIV